MKKEKKDGTENYLIFARKFRPETFEEVVGQEAVTGLLQNAVKTGRIPQGFLFAGPRGIGKTSTARILAKALNCEKGPTETPCNRCVNCDEITRTVSLDVLEIDGASNRGVEEVRTLRENVKFKPAQARFKIYLIDEVHMLTSEAFNALLKTLEEPPEHVKFIFATTEPHKVPLTVLSRCQRFNFKRIPAGTISKKLAEIACTEHLKAEPRALDLIARASDGALRDAETLLDQLSVFSKEGLREEEVLARLGLAGEGACFKALEALGKKDAGEILSLTAELYESGKDLAEFGRSLYELFRDLLLFRIGGGAEAFVDRSGESKKELARFKDIFSREELLLILSLFQNLQGELRRAIAPPKLLLETALLKLLHLEGLRSVNELIQNLGEGPKPPAPAPAPLPAKVLPQKAAAPPEAAHPADPETGLSLGEVERLWPGVLEAVKGREMSTGMFLAEAGLVEVSGRTITLGLPEEFQFHKEMLERAEKRKVVEEAFRTLLGFTPTLQFVTTRVQSVPGRTSQAPPDPKVPEIVRQAMDIFQGSKVVRTD